jgi:hypothetical protein
LCEHTFVFVIYDPQRPHIALHAAQTLKDVAAALAERREPGLTVGVNRAATAPRSGRRITT